MSETALKFGPEWLRVLGGSVSSPPPSPGIKFKLAEHRYGREEMLALFNKNQTPPDGIQTLGSLYVEEPQEPLAFSPMNEEQERTWQRCVNSDAVLRQSGRPPANGVGRGRGGSVDRGRGRGRGAGSYYTRGLSYDEEVEPRGPREGGPPGMSLRSKPFERSQSVHEQRAWSERGGVAGSGVPGGTEDRNGAVSPRKEQGRASTENWRSRGGESEDNERWRGVGANRNEKWGTRGWRERENGLENDWDDGSGRGAGRGVPVSARTSRPPWDEKDGRLRKSWDEDNLPEWATENADEKGGSFDASGAFHGPGWSDEEDPTAESRAGGGRVRQKLSPDKTARAEIPASGKHELSTREIEAESQEEIKNGLDEVRQKTPVNEIDKNHDSHKPPNIVDTQPGPVHEGKQLMEEATKIHEQQQQHHRPTPLPNGIVSDEEETREVQMPPEFQVVPSPVQPPQPNIQIEPGAFPPREHQAEEEKLEHMRSVADDLVAKLVEEDDLRPQTGSPSQVVAPPGPMGPIPDPTSHNNHATHTPGDDKWYYTDPQGEVQGPFTSNDMAEWYRAGYFTPSLLLKRECDDQFAQLGELTRIFARVPFVPGPPVPPHKVTEMINAQKQQAERERLELYQNYIIQKQVYQHQIAVSRQQVLRKLQSLEEWSSLNPLQQQQLFMQHMMNVIPPHPPTIPNVPVPPSTAPPTAIPAIPTIPAIPSTTQVSAPAPDPRVVAGPDMRVLPGPIPPVSKQQDPIQALVAQMQTSSAASSTPLTNTSDGLLTATSVAAENPLQKLILQLQRGQQSGMGSIGGNQTGSLGGAVTAAGITAVTAAGGPLDNTQDQQFDAIQSLMQQLTKMQPPTPDPLLEEHQRRQEEDHKRLEERRKLEEQKRAEEDRIKMEELRIKEELKRQEEQRRNLEVLRRQHEEETQRIEEERRKIREEQARRQEDIRRAEEKKLKIEEEQKRKQQDEQRARRREELRRQVQQQKQQEEVKRKEQARRQEETRRQEEEQRKRKDDEERRRREEEEEEARQQAQIQEEMRRITLEEERRHMQQMEEEERQRQAKEEERRQQHLLQEHLKNMLPAWNTPPPVQALEDTPAPSLLDIQRAQEEKERKEREVEQQLQQQRQRETQRLAAEEARQKNSSLKWAAVAQTNPTPTQPVKSLLEIQAEEEKELKKRQEKETAERAAAVSHMSIGAAGVWGSAISNLSWASRASSGRPSSSSTNQSTSQQWGGASSGSSGGMWNSSQSQPAASAPSHSVWNNEHSTIWSQADTTSPAAGGFWDNPEPPKSNKSTPASGRTPTKPTNTSKGGSGNQSTSNNRSNKKKSKDEDAVKKLFTDSMSPADDFTRWCKGALNTLKVHASIDIPTFVTFLAEVESPYEVHDYIRSYLGDSKEVKEFAKQYLERRSKARNAQKEREVEDDILAPAPAVNPTSTEFQEVKQTRNKKANKKKMQKVDNSILGFSVSSNERINIGERDYAE